jgi:hypothetical protein
VKDRGYSNNYPIFPPSFTFCGESFGSSLDSQVDKGTRYHL